MAKTMITAAMVAAMAMVATNAMAAGKGGLNLRAREVSGVININTATAKELDLLPGVGKKTAALIVAYREKQSFKAPADIMKVKGIGQGIFRKIKGYLAVSGPTTLAVKTSGPAPQPAQKADKPETAELPPSPAEPLAAN